MMPQSESGKPAQAQTDPPYGRYEENQSATFQQFDSPYQPQGQGGSADKVYAPPATGNNNLLRLIAFAMAIVALIIFSVICLLLVGGTGGWISFCAACLATFIIAAVTIDKIK